MPMKQLLTVFFAVLLFSLPVQAAAGPEGFDTDEQLRALGKDELVSQVPGHALELMDEAGVDLSVSSLIGLSPGEFFRTVWRLALRQIRAPVNTLAAIVGILAISSFLQGMGQASGGDMPQVFNMTAVLCVVLSAARPIFDCIMETVRAVQDAAFFMAGFVPVFSAAMMASGQPVTAGTYSIMMFTAAQVIAQVIARFLMPLMSVYLAMCVMGAVSPEINISSAAGVVKNIAGWVLGLCFTLFVALLSIQTMVGTNADTVANKSAKFLFTSFVPVVGSALSEAFSTAQGCLRLIKSSVGAYGIIAVVFTFLPILLNTLAWYIAANLGAAAGDIVGVPAVSSVMKACAGVLGILVAVILGFALLVIISTAIVMGAGMGAV
ncbi:MAG: hypothetical protein FWH02_07265 [Oscillospiraceae bacterium]|nr:hypothetical protein [Oscillospiraceae bacterium]